MWDKVKQLVSEAAPLVGSMIGGPVGGGIGTLIAHSLGVEPTPEAIEAELKSNPDALLKLKQMESDERLTLRKLKLEETGLFLQHDKARLRDTQDARKQHRDHWMPWLLTIILAAMVSGMFASLFLAEPPTDYAQVLIMIAGTVMGAFGTAVAFWLGSSQSSVTKSRQLTGGVNAK